MSCIAVSAVKTTLSDITVALVKSALTSETSKMNCRKLLAAIGLAILVLGGKKLLIALDLSGLLKLRPLSYLLARFIKMLQITVLTHFSALVTPDD